MKNIKGDVSDGEGVGWLYTGKVKKHFFHPKNIFATNKEAEKYEKTADGVGQVGSPACGDVMKMYIKVDKKKGTIKECRWQTFGSLTAGEKILSPDYSSVPVENVTINTRIMNEKSEPVVVEENYIRDYDGKIINISLSTSRFYNFSVTPNHPMPCIERDLVCDVKRKGRWSEVDKTKLQKAKSILKSASQLKIGDFLIFKVDSKTKDLKELDYDLCTLLGYYVSDGGMPSKNRILFYFGLNEMEYAKEIESICLKNKLDYKIFKRNTENVICLRINNREIVSLLSKHGGTPGKKDFSYDVLHLPYKKQMRIIESYIKGDGWSEKQDPDWQEQYFISTSVEKIAYKLQMMLARNKIFAPLHFREPRKFVSRGKEYWNNGEINLVFRKNQKYSRIKYHKKENSFLIPINKITAFDYSGKIYDLGLSAEPKVYKVKGISVHNCASAIASTSMLSEMVVGKKLEDAKKITPKDIVKALGGLPARKIHCSVLGDQALRAAIFDFEKKSVTNYLN